MLQLFSTILFITVFILLFIALAFYLWDISRRYIREGREQKALVRGVTSSDIAGLVTASPDATIVINQLGIIILANARAAALFGYTDVLGRVVDMLLPEHLRSIHQRHRAKYFADPRIRAMGAGLSLFGLHATGMVFPIEVSLSPLKINGEQHAIAIIRAKEP